MFSYSDDIAKNFTLHKQHVIKMEKFVFARDGQ